MPSLLGLSGLGLQIMILISLKTHSSNFPVEIAVKFCHRSLTKESPE